MNMIKKIKYLFACVVAFPSYLYLFCRGGGYEEAWEDMKVWIRRTNCFFRSRYMSYVYLMTEYPPFRNIMYYRISKVSDRYSCPFHGWWLMPAQKDIYILCDEIGGGFYISHGYGTTINAKKIGRNVEIFQGVTLGQKRGGVPTIGDNVTIYAGAKIIGEITIGDDVEVGCNAVVLSNVSDNHIAVGIPAVVKPKNKRY